MIRESYIEDYLVEKIKALGGEIRKVKWIGRRGAPDRYTGTILVSLAKRIGLHF